jgi:hypothetical protein
VFAERGLLLGENSERETPCLLARGEPAAVLVGVHPLVGQVQGLRGGRSLSRDGGKSERSPYRETVASLRQRLAAVACDAYRVRSFWDQCAELVATEPVNRPLALDRGGEAFAHATKQQVALWMAEGVVVALESVEVEHDEALRVGRRRLLDYLLEVCDQLAPVRQARERVVRCLLVELVGPLSH